MFLDDAIRFALRQSGLTTEDISKANIQADLLPAVVRKFSNLAPRHEIIAVTLVAGCTIYDPPVTGVLSIELTPAGVGAAGSLGGAPLGMTAGIGVTPGVDLYGDPTVAAIAHAMACPRPAFAVNLIAGQIQVFPTPQSAETMYLLVSKAWDFYVSEAVGTGDGSTAVFNLGKRLVWAASAFLDDDAVEEDIVNFANGNPATLRFDSVFAPAVGEVVSVTYLTASAFDVIPAQLRSGFEFLLASFVARSQGQKRARFYEIVHSESRTKIGNKELLRLADKFYDMAVAALDLSDADQGVVIQGG